jgi:hypothetical protein
MCHFVENETMAGVLEEEASHGDVLAGDGGAYTFFKPSEDDPSFPVLLHIRQDSYKQNDPSVLHLIKSLVVDNDACPYILITNSDHGMHDFLASPLWFDLDQEVNLIINLDTARESSYETLHDNLSVELESLLEGWDFVKIPYSLSSTSVELLSCTCGVPCITGGFDLINYEMWQGIPSLVEHPWVYTHVAPSENAGMGTAATVEPTDKHCLCCGKYHHEAVYHYSIQGALCPKCLKKIKGKVSVFTLAMAKEKLEQERQCTREANMLHRLGMSKLVCPRCGGRAASYNETTMTCLTCHKDFYVTSDLSPKECYFINGDSKTVNFVELGTQRLLKVVAAKDCSYLVDECWSCGTIVPTRSMTGVVDKHTGDEVWRVCPKCKGSIKGSL